MEAGIASAGPNFNLPNELVRGTSFFGEGAGNSLPGLPKAADPGLEDAFAREVEIFGG